MSIEAIRPQAMTGMTTQQAGRAPAGAWLDAGGKVQVTADHLAASEIQVNAQLPYPAISLFPNQRPEPPLSMATVRADLAAAAGRGDLLNQGAMQITASMSVTRSGGDYSIYFGGCFSSREVRISAADLATGRLNDEQRRAVQSVHRALHDSPMRPSWPMPVPQVPSWPPMNVPGVTFSASERAQALEILVQASGQQSRFSPVAVANIPGGFRLQVRDRGLFAPPSQVTITLQDIVQGVLTNAQFEALQRLATSQGRPFVPDAPSLFTPLH